MAAYRTKVFVVEAVEVRDTAGSGSEPSGSCFSEWPRWLEEAVKAGRVERAQRVPWGRPQVRVRDEFGGGSPAWLGPGDFVVLREGCRLQPLSKEEFLALYEAAA